MASDVNPGQISATAVSTAVSVQAGGKTLPAGGAASASVSATTATVAAAAAGNVGGEPQPGGAIPASVGVVKAPVGQVPQALVDLLNKHLNDSGRPAQYRVDPSSADRLIQEINPANGDVVGEFSVTEFPALARSLGVSGLLIDALA